MVVEVKTKMRLFLVFSSTTVPSSSRANINFRGIVKVIFGRNHQIRSRHFNLDDATKSTVSPNRPCLCVKLVLFFTV